MNVIVHDTISLIEPHVLSREHPKVRAAKAIEMFQSPGGLFPTLATMREQSGAASAQEVMSIIENEGFLSIVGDQGFGLFNPTRKVDACEWQFAEYHRLDVLAQIEKHLKRLAALLPDVMPEIHVYLLPSDPANRWFMIYNHGLNGSASGAGYIMLQLWPSAGNLEKLGAALAWLLAHNVRRAVVPGIYTLADWLASEGVAACFVEEAFLNLKGESWLLPFHPADDWEAELTRIATSYYGLTSYNDLVSNVYGNRYMMGSERPPAALPLAADEVEYSAEIIRAGLHTTHPAEIAAYLYGDENVARHGHPGMGLSPYAGFEIAYRSMKQTAIPVREAILLPTAEIIEKVRLETFHL